MCRWPKNELHICGVFPPHLFRGSVVRDVAFYYAIGKRAIDQCQRDSILGTGGGGGLTGTGVFAGNLSLGHSFFRRGAVLDSFPGIAGDSGSSRRIDWLLGGLILVTSRRSSQRLCLVLFGRRRKCPRGSVASVPGTVSVPVSGTVTASISGTATLLLGWRHRLGIAVYIVAIRRAVVRRFVQDALGSRVYSRRLLLR